MEYKMIFNEIGSVVYVNTAKN